MKKIVITLTLKKSVPEGEHRHITKNVTDYINNGTFVEGLEDAISCAKCLENVEGVKLVTVEMKK